MRRFKIVILVAGVLCALIAFSGCSCMRQADRVSYNISKEADSFNVTRKITVMNVRSDKIIMEMTGTFSISNTSTNELAVTCMVGPNQYKKHYIYLNDWTVYTVEDISGADVDPYKYELIFNPDMLVPFEFEVQ